MFGTLKVRFSGTDATHHPDTDIHERVEVLPDPEGETIQALQERVVLLEARLAALEAQLEESDKLRLIG